MNVRSVNIQVITALTRTAPAPGPAAAACTGACAPRPRRTSRLLSPCRGCNGVETVKPPPTQNTNGRRGAHHDDEINPRDVTCGDPANMIRIKGIP
ncbi:hypothetical protein EVAR_45274_1 [Eumeta japonica]|uniref:Uncharacterized protein n=1 Tax=Eumeta variegata TaxID=151549 RepID=A0A4C1XFL9_EUMVA|nr:hypothetical protein EVAR_45274_1 [Eumeta japonica]